MEPESTTIDESAESTLDVDLENDSGEDLLRAALGAPRGYEESDDSVSGVATPDPVPVVESVPNADAELRSEDVSKVLGHPRVQTQLREAQRRQAAQILAEARNLWEMEHQQQLAMEEEATLTDEEVGQRIRERQQVQPIVERAQQVGYTRAQQEFFHMGIGSVWTDVPELRSLDDSTKQTLDPASPNFRSYGEYINAVVDTVAKVRATQMAKSMAGDLANARVQSELSKIRRATPSPSSIAGPASGPGRIVDVDKMSGDELLRAAFN